MYNELLKQHEEILKKLTDKASKETDFGERGQFMNLQKMINNEIVAINDLKRAYKESESNKLCAYKLGVGKILIGQRGSGISSTLIDECLKYNRPLIVERESRVNQLVEKYPDVRVGWIVHNGNYVESNKQITIWTTILTRISVTRKFNFLTIGNSRGNGNPHFFAINFESLLMRNCDLS